jgi:hypothetical protein
MPIYPHHLPLIERLNTEFTKEKVAMELHRRAVQSRIQLVSRWAMITRKMKKEEPSYDVLYDFTDIIRYKWSLPANVLLSTDYIPNVVLLLSSSKGTEAKWAARALGIIAAGGAACKAACVSAGAVPALVKLLSSRKNGEDLHDLQAAKTLRCLVYNGYATDVIPAIKTLLTRYDISQETKIYLSLYILP